MGKQWISLLIFGFAVCAVVIGWDFFLAANGLKNTFVFSINPINTTLYEKVNSHILRSNKASEYAQKAEQVQGANEFFPKSE